MALSSSQAMGFPTSPWARGLVGIHLASVSLQRDWYRMLLRSSFCGLSRGLVCSAYEGSCGFSDRFASLVLVWFFGLWGSEKENKKKNKEFGLWWLGDVSSIFAVCFRSFISIILLHSSLYERGPEKTRETYVFFRVPPLSVSVIFIVMNLYQK
jgi:hypothetical protein